jgi:hypothetical protein
MDVQTPMTSTTTPMECVDCPPPPPPPPDILTLADIENDHVVLLAKEQVDGQAIRSLGTLSVLALKPVFVEWYFKGCPSAYPIYSVSVTPPARCSDGVVRTLAEYIEFCSGTTLLEQVGLFQAKLPDIQVSFANIQGQVALIVSKA